MLENFTVHHGMTPEFAVLSFQVTARSGPRGQEGKTLAAPLNSLPRNPNATL